ncbi:hypothetical protein BBJ28_00018487 [Nothophytophthora sp. Chile5]|nr:hypothetical protein BBJ28_00018487 [Nothophytophthora sp. Chile5]
MQLISCSARQVSAELHPQAIVGWACITRDEALMLSILRARLWMTDALEELIARANEAVMEEIKKSAAALTIYAADEAEADGAAWFASVAYYSTYCDC